MLFPASMSIESHQTQPRTLRLEPLVSHLAQASVDGPGERYAGVAGAQPMRGGHWGVSPQHPSFSSNAAKRR